MSHKKMYVRKINAQSHVVAVKMVKKQQRQYSNTGWVGSYSLQS